MRGNNQLCKKSNRARHSEFSFLYVYKGQKVFLKKLNLNAYLIKFLPK